ncbi:formylglycine-generating enzyme family protein [Candidatus Viridilinea mediisalina]|uniref:Sulfatase-modifying factor enzyme-like domain-containing protein n=1 Tax=Candidatus Viridilinea mediisalina TaxID=2024553 RepID=A0A2A6RDX8_9CHLR|nr:formylglycine-generating enzyme family protein [Candidatus Viridilinea mediisalina]PDW00196.1 hypothetical protein CJ255_20940 [Candidatus Viridilinea mediisalina]
MHPKEERYRIIELLIGFLALVVAIIALKPSWLPPWLGGVPAEPTPSSVSMPSPVPTTLPIPAAANPLPPWVPELVRVPAGPFLMGSRDDDALAFDREKPQHELTLPEYWIGRTEVTNAQFRPFVEGDGYTNIVYWTEAGWAWRVAEQVSQPRFWEDARFNGDEQPVVGVSWYEAVAYTRWLSAQTGHEFRLPSEAEWEKAARGPDGRIYPWGDAWDASRLNSGQSLDVGRTTPVGQYPTGASQYRALDMAGNVWEWCATKWRKGYPYRLEDEWTAAYLAGEEGRVLRGGSWYSSEAKFVRGAYRSHSDPRPRNIFNGLRVVSHAPVPGSGS